MSPERSKRLWVCSARVLRPHPHGSVLSLLSAAPVGRGSTLVIFVLRSSLWDLTASCAEVGSNPRATSLQSSINRSNRERWVMNFSNIFMFGGLALTLDVRNVYMCQRRSADDSAAVADANAASSGSFDVTLGDLTSSRWQRLLFICFLPRPETTADHLLSDGVYARRFPSLPSPACT